MSDTNYPPIDPVHTGIRGRCPRCGRGHIFDGFLTLKKQCEVCGLDYAFADPADGPAFFAICLAALPAVGVGIWLEMEYMAPLWVHLLVTLPVVLLSCILPLRPLKGWLVASQYFHKAEEGRLDNDYYESVKPSRNSDRTP